MTIDVTAIATRSSLPSRTPHPREPNHHSPKNRKRPIGSRMSR